MIFPRLRPFKPYRLPAIAKRNSHNMNQIQISLTPPEVLLRNCLLDCKAEMQSVPGMKELDLRWTGGWVRDKLLGVQSHDIDVALSTMTGAQFGAALQSFMVEHGQKYEQEAESQGFKAEIKNLHKIAANPEKSKHLETITTRMFGIDLDFVNLRKEVYTEDSRNPQMEFGTPEEDALRRDACCNALFYNVEKQLVEDFTQKGLADMDARILRTPLEPYQTFKDDPLRVLRLIRFASRLGYNIDDKALQAMKDSRIHKALRLKISRERVGVEIHKIVDGPDPYRGLTFVQALGLYPPVFANPASSVCPDHSRLPVVYDSLRRILDKNSAISLGLRPKDDQALTWVLAAYVPFKDSEQEALLAAREGIKVTNTVSKVLGDAIKRRQQLQALVKKVGENKVTRAEVGMALRAAGGAWRSHVMYALLCDVAAEEYVKVVGRYQVFLNYLQHRELMDAASIKPIINGNQVMQLFDVRRAGSWLKDALDMVVEWQFENPNGTADEARTMLNGRRGELNFG